MRLTDVDGVTICPAEYTIVSTSPTQPSWARDDLTPVPVAPPYAPIPQQMNYTPLSAYERPETYGCAGTGLVNDAPGLSSCFAASLVSGKEVVGTNGATYRVDSTVQVAPQPGQQVTVRGNGATLAAPAGTDVFRMLYILPHLAAAVAPYRILVEGLTFNGNGRSNFPLEIRHPGVTTHRGAAILRDLNFLGGNGPATGNAAQCLVTGYIGWVEASRLNFGAFIKPSGQDAADYTNLSIVRDGSNLYPQDVLVDGCDLGGVFATNTLASGADSDSLKLFGELGSGSTPVRGDENFRVRNTRIEISAGRGAKVQAPSAQFDNILFTTRENRFTAVSADSGKTGNRGSGIDFQYGGGTARSLRFELEDGRGVDFLVTGTARAYSRPRQMLAEGVSVTKRGSSDNPVQHALWRHGESGAVKAAATLRNFVSDHDLASFARVTALVDGRQPGNAAELTRLEQCRARALTQSAFLVTRTAPGHAVLSSGGCVNGGSSVPAVVQQGGGSDFTHTVTATNTGIS